MRELRQTGIQVVSLNDPEVDPETVAGVYMEAITFAQDEAYSREVAFHTRKGCRANIQTRARKQVGATRTVASHCGDTGTSG